MFTSDRLRLTEPRLAVILLSITSWILSLVSTTSCTLVQRNFYSDFDRINTVIKEGRGLFGLQVVDSYDGNSKCIDLKPHLYGIDAMFSAARAFGVIPCVLLGFCCLGSIIPLLLSSSNKMSPFVWRLTRVSQIIAFLCVGLTFLAVEELCPAHEETWVTPITPIDGEYKGFDSEYVTCSLGTAGWINVANALLLLFLIAISSKYSVPEATESVKQASDQLGSATRTFTFDNPKHVSITQATNSDGSQTVKVAIMESAALPADTTPGSPTILEGGQKKISIGSIPMQNEENGEV